MGPLQMDYEGDEAHARLIFPAATAVRTRVYMGPKAVDLLDAVSPALNKAIDFGWMSFIALLFLRGLTLLYRVAPNYGVDIILLTVVVRLLTIPMSIKRQRSMIRMHRLQPQVERIREKFKDDNERLNREMVDLYKRNHANPLCRCLTTVV